LSLLLIGTILAVVMRAHLLRSGE